MLRPQFRAVRTGQRYLREDVDALVARVLATAERRADGTEITVDEVRNAAFMTPPLLVVGYSAEDVDSFLDEAERWLPGHRNIQSAVPATPLGPIGERVAPRFTPVRWREGYDVTEVDAFVDRVMATVNGRPVERPVTAGEIRTIQFSPVRMSEGYDVEEVDAFLDTAGEWLSGPR
ncbi:DivIVA domain-containing protein [Kribbella sp. NPDC048915]|uniref:DivIVA domain-containing protein n=1 Tax=Kribbella sp. NPDC048915 TaxID=3155148 RepID=UPI0033EBC346